MPTLKNKYYLYVLTPIFLLFLIGFYRLGLYFSISYKLLFSPYNISYVSNFSKKLSLPKSECDQSLWDRVYSPSRLYLIQPCVMLPGTIDKIEREADGDNHIHIKPKQGYLDVANIFNIVLAGGNIVGETVCLQNKDIEEEAEKVCQGYENKVLLPKVGDQVRVYGSLVLDKAVGWIEIHPITKIEVF